MAPDPKLLLMLDLQTLRGSSDWQRLIEVVASFKSLTTEHDPTEDQLWLSFNQEVLVYLEILCCTCTGFEPKFAVCLMQTNTTNSTPWLDATGLERCLMSCLLDITMLRRWKDTQTSKGCLSITELVKRSLSIEQALQQQRQANLERMKSQLPRDSWAFTNVFASAASVFLHATISGARPQIPEIRKGVSDTIEALKLLPRPDLLKRLAWPLCITACLVEADRYDFFNALSQRVTEAYGKDENISRAFGVARECWKIRGSRERDDQTYDWRDAMRSLGTPLLLF